MSSPFSNSKEFLEADGPIYTFGNNSTIVTFFLIVSAILFLWFIYASYKIKSGKPPAKNPVVLSLIIAASALSLVGTAYNSTVDKMHQPPRKEAGSRVINSKKQQGWQLPMTLVGMVASNLLRRSHRRRKRIKSTNRNQH